jgi:hypothetical protein
MAYIPCNTRACRWNGGSFRPTGKLLTLNTGAAVNPAVLQSKRDLWSARLFVGFNVRGKPRWTVDDLVDMVFAARKKQCAKRKKRADKQACMAATVLVQKGIFEGKRGRAEVEDSAQVIILHIDGSSIETFRREMLSLAGTLAKKMQQEQVLVEFQKNGMTEQFWNVTP